jgi:hypothetical protein
MSLISEMCEARLIFLQVNADQEYIKLIERLSDPSTKLSW